MHNSYISESHYNVVLNALAIILVFALFGNSFEPGFMDNYILKKASLWIAPFVDMGNVAEKICKKLKICKDVCNPKKQKCNYSVENEFQ